MTKKLQYFSEHRHATWLELFFDLVFVAAIGVVAHNVAHVHHGHIPVKQLLLFPLEFLPLWWIWATHTLYANRFDADSKGHRLACLGIMLLLAMLSAFFGTGLVENYGYFIAFYSTIRLVLAWLYYSSRKSHDGNGAFASAMGICTLAGAVLSVVTIFLPESLRLFALIAIIVAEMIVAVFVARRTSTVEVHKAHLVERVGLLSIILIGESVISMVAGLRGIEWNFNNILAAASGFALLGSLWWIYFDSFNVLERAKRLTHGFVLLYSHVLFCIGLVLIASAIRHAILDDIAMADFRNSAVTGLILFYAGKQINYYSVFPPYRINIIINSCVCIIITVLATLLSSPAHSLTVMMLGMFFYSYSNIRWTISKDVSNYLVEE